MIHLNSKKLALVLTISSLAATAGCGSAPTLAPTQFNAVTQTVSPATLPYSYGTLPPNTMAGCSPINQPIGFQASGIYMDTLSIYGGIIPPYVDKLQPSGAIVGQVMTTPGTAGMVGAYQPVQNQAGTVDGNMSLNATPTSATTANATGTITLSPTKLQIIYGLFGLTYGNLSTPYTGGVPQYGFPNPGMPFNTPGMTPVQLQAQTPCVSGIAISLTHSGTTLYGGRVYLYLNGQQHGDYLKF